MQSVCKRVGQEQEVPQSLNRLAGVSTITAYNSTFNLFFTGVHEKWNKLCWAANT